MKPAPILLLLALTAACRTAGPTLEPGDGTVFQAVSARFAFREGRERQSGRVLWRCGGELSKFVFFTPLNQAGLELAVEGEEAVLANFSSRTYWKGDFSLLLGRLWGIGLPLAELKALLLEGRVPPRLAENGIEAWLEGEPGAAPRQVRLRRGEAELSLRLLKVEARPGRLVRVDYERRYRGADLEEVLGP